MRRFVTLNFSMIKLTVCDMHKKSSFMILRRVGFDVDQHGGRSEFLYNF
jgi:hypothetical protein